jgi:hypothetical protein
MPAIAQRSSSGFDGYSIIRDELFYLPGKDLKGGEVKFAWLVSRKLPGISKSKEV